MRWCRYFIFFTSIALPAWAMIGYWFIIQVLSGLFSGGDMGGVAFWAHVGGFIAGVALIKLFARAGIRRRPPSTSMAAAEGMES